QTAPNQLHDEYDPSWHFDRRRRRLWRCDVSHRAWRCPVTSSSRRAQACADDRVDDATSRLLPGLAVDASEPVGTTLRELSARLHDGAGDVTAVRQALDRARTAVARLRSSDRADAATIDALALELDVEP